MVDSLGHLHLNIPTQIEPGQVNIVIVINPIVASKDQTKDQHPNYDFTFLYRV